MKRFCQNVKHLLMINRFTDRIAVLVDWHHTSCCSVCTGSCILEYFTSKSKISQSSIAFQNPSSFDASIAGVLSHRCIWRSEFTEGSSRLNCLRVLHIEDKKKHIYIYVHTHIYYLHIYIHTYFKILTGTNLHIDRESKSTHSQTCIKEIWSLG